MVNYNKYKLIDNIEFIPSPNFSNRNADIDMIIIHYTASNRIGDAIDWFQRKESKVSSHYIIGRDGRIVQMVHDQYKAWHAGYSYWDGQYLLNKNSIGIELVGTETSGFSPQQMESLILLTIHLVNKYNIDLKRIIGHEHCSGVTAKSYLEKQNYPYNGKIDPGKHFDWAEYLSGVEEYLIDEKKIVDEEPIENDVPPEDIYKPMPMIKPGDTIEDYNLLIRILFLIKIFISKILGV